MTRLQQVLESLHGRGGHPCIVDAGRCHTFAHLACEIERWQSFLDERQVAPGMVVGIRADYSLPAVAALFALLARAGIAVLVPRDCEPRRYLADACATALLEFDAQAEPRWSSIPGERSHPLLERLRTAGEGGFVIFTSGSTGPPKAALQSVERFLSKFRKPGRCLRTLAFLRLDHVAGLDTLFYTVASGGTLILTRKRDPLSILELVESQRVEVLPASPSFLRLLCAARECPHDLSSLRVITYGSETMDPATLERLNARFPNAQISQKYGTTETGSPRSASRSNDSLWLKIKNEDVDVKIVDGMLWLRSEATMLGYLNAPSPIDHEGWYCTGDLVDVDGEWVRFRGRITDVINVGGEKVSPTEVEQRILELDFVRDALVTGEQHPLLGRIVTALVALTPDAPAAKEAVKRIRSHCRQGLARYKVPVSISITAETFANDRQKVQRNQRP